jgi:hypothetical protein
MVREPAACRCRGSTRRLCGAADGLCARLPRSTGVRGPTALSSSDRLPGAASSACGAAWRLAGARCGSSSRPGANASASTGRRASADRRCGSVGTSGPLGRGHSGCSESLLCLDLGLLGLERGLGMGQWPLGGAAQANRRLGGWALDATRPRLRLDRRWLALALNHSCGFTTAITMASGRRYFCATALTWSSVTASYSASSRSRWA